MKTVIIIPTYNEKDNIEAFIKEIKKFENFEILVVDGNSNDGTKEILKKISDIHVLNQNKKTGLADAYINGFKYAIELGFDAFIQMDADFSHNPEYLPVMLEKLEENDVVIASRNIKGGGAKDWGLIRTMISKGGSLYSKVILNCPINDLTGGFNGWKLDIINKIGLDTIISKGFCFQIEMKYKAFKNSAKITEFPIIFEDRRLGSSKMSKNIFFEALLNVIKIRLQK